MRVSMTARRALYDVEIHGDKSELEQSSARTCPCRGSRSQSSGGGAVSPVVATVSPGYSATHQKLREIVMESRQPRRSRPI